MHKISWEARAAAKRAATLDKIHPDWRLPSRDIERARQQRNLTGSFIEQFLDEKMVSITSMNSPEIVKAVAERNVSASEVARAFCKRAAVAHQIVNSPSARKTRIRELTGDIL
jgi:amidase